MKEAKYYTTLENGTKRCILCPHYCVLKEGETGKCHVRTVREGKLISENYGKVTALRMDPIEKKPLYHFFPGSQILSVGSFGCNLQCGWCQNCEIAHNGVKTFSGLPEVSPEVVVQSAVSSEGTGVAFTYNEPSVWFEYMMDIASAIKDTGLKNVVVTNGYLNKQPLKELLRVADAFNTDLKGFSDVFYRERTGGSLRQVMKNLQLIAAHGQHQEITFLVIPGLNDHQELFREMVRWIADELGNRTVLHISRYFPYHEFHVAPTPVSVIERLINIARQHLEFVYSGNLHSAHSDGLYSNTYCPVCNNLLVERDGYHTSLPGLSAGGFCSKCKEKVIVSN